MLTQVWLNTHNKQSHTHQQHNTDIHIHKLTLFHKWVLGAGNSNSPWLTLRPLFKLTSCKLIRSVSIISIFEFSIWESQIRTNWLRMFFWHDVGFQCASVSAQKNTMKFRKSTVPFGSTFPRSCLHLQEYPPLEHHDLIWVKLIRVQHLSTRGGRARYHARTRRAG